MPALAGCGGSSTGLPTIQAAHVYSLADFKPAAPVRPGRPTTVSFVIRQPDGTALTDFKTGPGPHTGVHLILVRRDLAYFVHRHPSVAADGTISQQVVFPASGSYRVVIDVYPASGPQTNFQLFDQIRVAGAYKPKALPPPGAIVDAGGYRFKLSGASHLKALQAQDVTVNVTDPHGPPRELRPVVRSARTRDLLPPRDARLLPHARLLARCDRLHERPRAREGHGHVDDTRKAERRRSRCPRPGSGASSSRPRSAAVS